ncbi:NAD(P)/FAD-dependent oxidoreductase [Catenulispora pinisilvae]|uniref:NAD(P)/FAD-dependent oxidoreductase n=1 Tax=Catenulispora pinisilvae TaxID=2705253 RepID=UPI001891F66B|nr:FAD-dependent oxidoreductase [Catenulispora pinisilvae]
MTGLERIVVVGASQAGCGAASALRGLGFDGEITVIGDEPHRPYTRPPLSKGVLTGVEPEHSVFLPAPDDVRLRTGVTAVGLDREKSAVELADGEHLPYDGLVIATGARARRLGTAVGTGVGNGETTLRGLDDAVGLRGRLADSRDVAVAGAGFLGLEIASAAVGLGKAVTVVDQFPALLGRLGPLLADLVLAAAAEHGVRVSVAPAGVRIDRSGRLLTTDGALLAEADLVVTAAGDVPNTEWLHGSGIRLDGGVVIDNACRVAPNIVAAGDVVSAPGRDGRMTRSPHWWSALSQAKIAAATLLGREPADLVGGRPPFFWTEMFGLKIRMAGRLPPVGEPTVLDGSIAQRRALLLWPGAGPGDAFGTAVSVNLPISAPKLTRLAQRSPAHQRTL